MSTWIGLEAVAEIPFPGIYVYNPALAVVVHVPEKGKEIIAGGVYRSIGNGKAPVPAVFSQNPEREMKPLTVPWFRFINIVQKLRHPRNQGKKSQITKIKGSIEGRTPECAARPSPGWHGQNRETPPLQGQA